MDVRLQELNAALAQMGRAAVLIGVKDTYTPGALVTVADTERWDGSGPLYLAHLGNTEGEVASAVDVAISALRKKIELDASEPRIITSVRGTGYRWLPLPSGEARGEG